MASDPSANRAIRLRDYRYPGEVLSLVLTSAILLTLYALAALYLAASWSQTLKAFAITLLGLSVYIISVLVQQRAAFGTLVRVSSRQFPELYERTVQAAEFLGSPPVTVYVRRSSEMMIYTLGFRRQPIIVITSSMVDQMELDDLQFFIGREIGHIRAGHTWLRTLLKPLGSDVPVVGKLLNSVIFGDWINRTEYTADRAGFIACRSLTTAIKSMLKFGVGIRLFEKLDISEFLEQIREVHNVRGRVTEIVAEQPYLTQRIRGLVRFAFSSQFQMIVPEKRTHTQILSALPKNYLSNFEVKESASAARPAHAPEPMPGNAPDPIPAEPPPPPPAPAITPAASVQASVAPVLAPAQAAIPVENVDHIGGGETERETVVEPPVPGDNELDPQLILIAADSGQVHVLRRWRTRIGRNRDNDLVIVNDRVSRYHAEIVRQEDRLLLIDRESRNGVWLNGWRIAAPTELKPGDRIRIGRQEFNFNIRR